MIQQGYWVILPYATVQNWPHLIHFIPGIHNTMADTASRSFHLSNSDFLTHFNSHFPQPTSWTLHHLQPGTISSLISALCKRPSPLASQPPAPVLPPWLGNSGSRFAHPSTSTSTPSFHPSKIKFPSYKYFPTVTNTAPSPPSKRQVRACTVEDAVRQIAQTYASLGPPDPRLNPFGDLDFRLLCKQ